MMKKWWVGLLVVALLVSSISGCAGNPSAETPSAEPNQSNEEPSEEPVVFTAALGVMPSSLDPTNLNGAGDMHFSRNLYEPLVEEVRGTTELEPWLSTEWEVPDAKTYIFTLREGVKFHDGTILDAEDVVYSYTRAQALVSSVSSCVAEIASIEAVDDMTVKITLAEENSSFLYNVAKIGIVSKEFCEEHETDGDLAEAYLVKHSCGTGAYETTEYVEDQYVTMSRFDEYWGGWNDNQVDVVQTVVVGDNATQIQMLNSGEVDKLQIPITEYLDVLESNPSIDVLKAGSLQTNIFTFNTQKFPFDNSMVRKAVTLAFDYAAARDNVYNGYASIPSGFMPASFAEHNSDIPEQHQDLEEAKRIMDESGVGECSISIHLCEGSDDQLQLAQILQGNLAEIGIELDIKVMPWTSLAEENTSPETAPEMSALNMGSFTGDSVFYLRQNFDSANSGGSYNWSFYEKDEFDTLVRTAAKTVDDEERLELLYEAQQMLVDDYAALYVVSPDSVEAINNKFHGYVIHPLDYYYSIRVYQLTVD